MVSVLLHVGLVVGVVLLIPSVQEESPQVIEVEIFKTVQPPQKAVELAPQAVPQTEPEPEPTIQRPPRVPDRIVVKKVEKEAWPYHPQADLINRQEAASPDATPSLELPKKVPGFEIAMEATVEGGEGIEVLAVAGTTGNVLADPDRPGSPDVQGPPPAPTRPPDVELSDSWEITVEPKPINDRDFEPDYPFEARARGIEAVVVIELLIDSRGRVARARVVRSGGGDFDAAGLAYCRKLRFKPAEANGVPVATRIEWTVLFRCHNE
jgi:protein TonB